MAYRFHTVLSAEVKEVNKIKKLKEKNKMFNKNERK